MSSKKPTTDEELEEGALDDDTTDSLEIKPPQAQRMEKKHKKKNGKERRHDKHYRHEREDERYPPQERQKYYEQRDQQYHHQRYQSASRYTEYFQHPGRPGRDREHQRYEQQNYHHRSHSEGVRSGGGGEYYKSAGHKRGYEVRSQEQQQRHYNERSRPERTPERPSSQSQVPDQQLPEPQEPITVTRSPTPEEESDKLLNDLRQKLLMKKKKHDEEMAQREDDGTEVHKKHKKRKKHRHQQEIDEEEGQTEVIEVDEDSHGKREVESPEDEETVARRARLLKANREMARRKEAARVELEARRERHRDTAGSQEESPPSSDKKKRKDNLPVSPRKKIKSNDQEKGFEDIVMVSDPSAGDDDDDDETDSESDSESDSVNSEDESEHERPVSPPSESEFVKKDRRHRSKSVSEHSRHRSGSESSTDSEDFHSRSRSHSRSDHERSRSRSRSDRSRSRSRRRSRDSRSHSRDRSRSGSHSRSSFEISSDEGGKASNRRPRSPKSPKKGSSGGEDPDPNKKNKMEVDETPELPSYYPAIQGCRSVEEFQCLNRIEEGTYGVVYRAKDKRTEEIVALKRLKMEKEKEGFPITSLREINTLLKGQHPNIVTVREIVVGSNMDKIFIVMDYVEHDLKSLMETMKHKKQVFLPGEVKCLMQQLLRAVAHLHDNWILHRDLKTSNLLLSHKGILKVGDFGLAREYGSPLKPYTPIVVTLWYRAPELLLGCKEYSTPIDVWSVGCIFAEFMAMTALFTGKSEVDQLNRIFKELGTPNEKIWPGYKDLPAVQKMTFTEYPVSNLRKHFSKYTSELGIALLQGLLTYDPKQRVSAEKALKSSYFEELPLPIDPAMFPTWPAKSELGLKKALASSPKPPSGGGEFKRLGDDPNDPGFKLAGVSYAESRQFQMGPGFSLKF